MDFVPLLSVRIRVLLGLSGGALVLDIVGVDARLGVEANRTDFFSSLTVAIVLKGL